MGIAIITLMVIVLIILILSLYKCVDDYPSCLAVGFVWSVPIGIIIGTASEMLNK